MKKLIGNKAMLFFDTFDPSRVIHGDGTVTTAANTWYFVVGRGTGESGIPQGFRQGGIFRSPKTGSAQLVLEVGDRVMPIDPSRFCKTSADWSVEQGTIDVGDDCDPGATLLDGVLKLSGSFSGFFQEDLETGDFTEVTFEILNRFFDLAEDDGEGNYAITPRTNDILFLMILLNSEVKAGQMEKWLLTPIVIPSLSSSIGMTDAQNMDTSWQQGEGQALLYRTPHR
ncbi:MAG: hypothetical protein LBT00_08535 [Spirochaetaceae bacterium]|jgi:hypothetical protein|nr:hypothetical protein [Spirochaetaceae bacterium]